MTVYTKEEPMDKLELLAWGVAKKAHANQMYGKNELYIEHIKRVFYRVREASRNTDLEKTAKLAAILHDVVENSDVYISEISEQFGARIGLAVYYLTHKEEDSYFEYIKEIRNNPTARLVKICDLLDNLQHSYLNIILHADKIVRYEKAIVLLAT